MDEPDIFRQVWEQMQAEESHVQDTVSIDEIIRKRSRQAVSKYKNSLLFELWAGVAVLTGLIAVYLMHPSLQYGYFLLVIIAMLLVCIFYHYHQYRNLNRLEPQADTEVKEYLVSMLKWMKMFLQVYLRLNQVIIASFILILMVFGLNSSDFLASEASGNSQGFTFLLMLMISFITTLIFFPIQKLLIHRMFGRYLQQLKDNLQELEPN